MEHRVIRIAANARFRCLPKQPVPRRANRLRLQQHVVDRDQPRGEQSRFDPADGGNGQSHLERGRAILWPTCSAPGRRAMASREPASGQPGRAALDRDPRPELRSVRSFLQPRPALVDRIGSQERRARPCRAIPLRPAVGRLAREHPCSARPADSRAHRLALLGEHDNGRRARHRWRGGASTSAIRPPSAASSNSVSRFLARRCFATALRDPSLEPRSLIACLKPSAKRTSADCNLPTGIARFPPTKLPMSWRARHPEDRSIGAPPSN